MTPDEVCEVHILSEGYKGGFLVKVVGEAGSQLWHVRKNDLANAVHSVLNRVNEGDLVDSSTSTNQPLHWNNEVL